MITRPILGESLAVKNLIKLIERISNSKINALVVGESGTGKELVARMLHEFGPLKTKPFVPVNCGAIPENLIESEMFGHKRGSFTGAVADKMGLFEAANGGTLFLDEVGELPLSMQVKLLRAIQDHTVRMVGGTQDIKVDVRIIAATNRNLEDAVASKTFREDLYYRLNVVQIRTPPLREREKDIELLADVFLKKFNDKQGKKLSGYDPEVIKAFYFYKWPGNIREFENVIERAVTLENSTKITLQALPGNILKVYQDAAPTAQAMSPSIHLELPPLNFNFGAIDLKDILTHIEKSYVEAAYLRMGKHKEDAAGLLGDSEEVFEERLVRLGLEKASEQFKTQNKKSKKPNKKQPSQQKRRK